MNRKASKIFINSYSSSWKNWSPFYSKTKLFTITK